MRRIYLEADTRALFPSPDFPDLDDAQKAQRLWTILGIVSLSFTLESLVDIVLLPALATRWLLVILLVDSTALILFAISRRGYIRQASLALVVIMWALVTVLAVTEGGIRTPTIDIAYLVIILLAGLILGEKAGIVTGVISCLSLFALSELSPYLPPLVVRRTAVTIWEADVFYLAIAIGLQYMAVHTIRQSLDQTHHELMQRKQAEERLKKAKEYAERLIQTANGIVVGLDGLGRITLFNQAAQEITGYSQDEVIGRQWVEVFMPREHFGPAWEKLTHPKGGTFPANFENPIITRSGEERWIAWHTSEIRDQGDMDGTICFGVDITDHRQLENERMKRQLQTEVHRMLTEQVEQERLKIARDLHDGPVQDLVAATFTVQCLIEDAVSDEMGTTLKDLQNVLQDQISSLRGFAGELRSPTLAKFGLEKAINEHLDNLSARDPGLSVQFTAEQDETLLPEEARLTFFRVFQEAMNNIMRHAHASEVNVRFQKDPAHAELVIEDNGIGFDPPSDWMDLARKGHLGMVGMRERIELIGGALEVESRPGKGTTLRISAPLDHQGEAQDEDLGR